MLQRHGIAGISGVDTRRLTRLIRDDGFGCRRVRASRPARDVAGRCGGRAGHGRHRPRRDGRRRHGAVHGRRSRTARVADRRLRLRHQAHDPATSRPARHGRGRAGTTPAADALARDPDGIFLSNGPGDPAVVAGATGNLRELLGSGRAGLRHLPRPPAARPALGGAPSSSRSVTTAPTIRCRTSPPGGGDHQPEPQLRRRRDDLAGVATMTHINLNDGVCGGSPAAEANVFSVQHHPEAGPGPHDSAYLFERFAARMTGSVVGERRADVRHEPRIAGHDSGGRLMPRRDDLPRSSSSVRGRSSSARRASSTTRARRHAARCARRAIAWSSPTPTRRRS